MNRVKTMFEYRKFKAAVQRHRYETAFEMNGKRVSYREFAAVVEAAFNALSRVNETEGGVLLLSRDAYCVATVALACSKAGFACTVADSRLPAAEAQNAHPALVILPQKELERLGKVLFDGGCRQAIVTQGGGEERVFPSQFVWEELLDRNDYVMTLPPERGDGMLSFASGAFADAYPPALEEIPLRAPVRIDLPVYENAGALALSLLLYGGHRVVAGERDKTAELRRKKVKYVVCNADDIKSYEQYGCRTVCPELDASRPFVYAGGGLLEAEKLSRRATEILGVPARCTVEETMLRVITQPDGDWQPTPEQKRALSDLLYPFDLRKKLVLRKKSV